MLKRVSKNVWEIPVTYKKGMRVPARIYATETLIKNLDEGVIEQVTNVATLPGIQKFSFAMPDAHRGYGFCLHPETRILTSLGYYIPIKDFEFGKEETLKSANLEKKKIDDVKIKKFFKLRPYCKVFKIRTKLGFEIISTEDHPFFSSNGKKQLKDLRIGDKIAVYPFEGVKWENPSNELIIDEKDIRISLKKLGIDKTSKRAEIIIKKILKRKLLPLTYNHPLLPYLIKLIGYIFGDGSMNFIGKKREGIIHFSGKKEDLEEIRKDIFKLGYTPSRVFVRKKGNYEISFFYVNASSLLVLLYTLGVPIGNKTIQKYRLPNWLKKAKLWQKRLFLSSYFGAELRKPYLRKDRKATFVCPTLQLNKEISLLQNGIEFLKDIGEILSEFGIREWKIKIRKKRHKSKKKNISIVGLELRISSKIDNLISLWSKIGFEYNKERQCLANFASAYLRYKKSILREKREAIFLVKKHLESGKNVREVAKLLATPNPLTERFLLDVGWKIKRGIKIDELHIPFSFLSFEEFILENIKSFGKSGLLWDEICEIKEVEAPKYVYDFTIDHSNHNFIANGILVSNCIGGVAAFDEEEGGVISPGGVGYDINCGVRILKTNLTIKELKPKLKELIEVLFKNVPAGVGARGAIQKLDNKTFDEVMQEGVKWCLREGYATQRDLEHCEDYGCLPYANPEKVSEKARARGRDQVGTLGSGNHFLEIQEVLEIYDENSCKVMGIEEKGQICVMIHCGSRGFGHQVATDYLRIMEKAMRKYNIPLIDRELMCAPIKSKEGEDYFEAMCCAANMSFANRQVITHLVRKSFEKVFKQSWEDLGIELIYDVAHNIAKKEVHELDGKKKEVYVHRKGATRALPKEHPLLPKSYFNIGQPVLIPGAMGTESYVCIGLEGAKETFYSCCHGAGRVMSRTQAKRMYRGDKIKKELEKRGVIVRAKSMPGLAEEVANAYKNVSEVVRAVVEAGIVKLGFKVFSVGNIKG